MRHRRPAIERFWERVDRHTCLGDVCGCHKGLGHCWPWIGRSTQKGYGIFKQSRTKDGSAHRFLLETIHGPLDPSLMACHLCDNPPCCRPDHLFAGTQQENIHDALMKGRMATGPRHGTYTHPESRASGLRNGYYTTPQDRRGEKNARAKLSDAQVLQIFAMQGQKPAAHVAKQFNVSDTLILMIWKQRTRHYLFL